VPAVDPKDIKTVWEKSRDLEKRKPAGQLRASAGATGVACLKRICKPGADVMAVSYRAGMIEMFRYAAPELMDPLLPDKLDVVFLAAAEIPMEWIGVGVPRQGFPFDADDFIRRVREA
jgi:hypothetical protein